MYNSFLLMWRDFVTTKHNQILQYIESLPIGEKISVRGIAKHLNMSEGTAYRAIKNAESLGIVSTIERVGTIRIEKKSKFLPEMLRFNEIISLIEGEVLGGEEGLDRHLNKFIIGAMTEDAVKKYFIPNSLIIVGNREGVQKLALENDVAVLITGGFDASDQIIELANEKKLPVISTSFDSFTVATIINRSMADQEIKKDIMTIADVYTPIEPTESLTAQDSAQEFFELSRKTGLSRFPVHHNGRLIGVVTAKDLIGKSDTILIDRVMTKELVTVQKHMTVASVSHLMVREDIEMIPVVEDNLELLGVVTRQDIMRGIQLVQKQPQIVNTFHDDIVMHFEEYIIRTMDNKYDYRVVVQPQMINSLGTISYGILCELITHAASQKFFDQTNQNLIIENIDMHYFKLIQMGNEIQFKVDVFNQNRKAALIEVDVYHENTLGAKTILTAQIIESI